MQRVLDPMRTPVLFSPAHPTPSGNRLELGVGRNPSRRGLDSFESRLVRDHMVLLAADPAIATAIVRPETFVWRDPDGGRHAFTPDILAVRVDGSRVYRTVRPHARLLRDVDLRGRRERIVLECAARGATFELWTEREIREATCGWPLLRVASFHEIEKLEESIREEGEFGGANVPGLVLKVAERLGLRRPRKVGRTFLARSLVTGILMAVLCDLRMDLETGALNWKPSPRVS